MGAQIRDHAARGGWGRRVAALLAVGVLAASVGYASATLGRGRHDRGRLWARWAEGAALVVLTAGFVQARAHRGRELDRLVAQRTVELEMCKRQLERIAFIDSLTGLPNRRAFDAALEAACRDDAPFALALIDLDRFKNVNDTLGHPGGDAFLSIAANRLRACLREGDLVARTGGDEFAVLFQGVTDPSRADFLCERIVNLLGGPTIVRETLVSVGASVGMALFPTDAATPADLVERADIALYDAKHAGRGVWRWYRAGMATAEAGAPG